uniref:Protein N-terminal glutamine amidohydrolase n=1 Tax=Physcomitrium patens TaxID=3218 RepID=A0A7I4ECE7_PHYPA|nr:protein N-terminal glutamine amidohydrolase-like isoform X2 [Physcomitrium patens]|eukprot:XP_024382569.1 protein N-terminal glutamine amidohydrolase-like isoform X2 [Physcomitrella patens]
MDGPNSSTNLEFSGGGSEYAADEEFGKDSGASEKVEDVLSSFDYTSCYCEENVYMLCKKLSKVGLAAPDASDLFAVFISNPKRQVPIWRQRSSKDAAGLCVWDYHVICIQRDLKRETAVLVWDLDTSLPCPTTLDDYVAGAFQPWIPLNPEFSRFYRVIAAPMYLRFFASDRRHMKKKDGSWMALPPLYDCLVAEDGAVHNLEEFITMSVDHVITSPEEAISSLLSRA